jgi:hypothetical protein
MKKMMMILSTLMIAFATLNAKPVSGGSVGVSFLAGQASDGWFGSKLVACLMPGKACTWNIGFGVLNSGAIDNTPQPTIISNGTIMNMNADELTSFKVSENHSFPLTMTGTKRYVNLPIQDAPKMGTNTFQFKLEISDKPLYTIQ